MRDATSGTNFTLSALFLTAKMQRNPKCAKIGIVKFALLERPYAISMLALRALNLVVRRFIKTLCAAGLLLICGRLRKSAH